MRKKPKNGEGKTRKTREKRRRERKEGRETEGRRKEKEEERVTSKCRRSSDADAGAAAGHPWGSHARRQTLGVEGTASLEEDASQAFYKEEKSMPGF